MKKKKAGVRSGTQSQSVMNMNGGSRLMVESKKAARARHQVNKSQRKSGSSQEAVSIRSRLDDEAQAPARRGEKNVREQA
eukprot:scaffold1505_cov146-Skeletonema_marinoi.AAC.8